MYAQKGESCRITEAFVGVPTPRINTHALLVYLQIMRMIFDPAGGQERNRQHS